MQGIDVEDVTLFNQMIDWENDMRKPCTQGIEYGQPDSSLKNNTPVKEIIVSQNHIAHLSGGHYPVNINTNESLTPANNNTHQDLMEFHFLLNYGRYLPSVVQQDGTLDSEMIPIELNPCDSRPTLRNSSCLLTSCLSLRVV